MPTVPKSVHAVEGGELARATEGLSILHGGSDGRGDDRADAGDGHEARRDRVGLGQRPDLAVEPDDGGISICRYVKGFYIRRDKLNALSPKSTVTEISRLSFKGH
jgi:hypothetical protein